MAIVPQIVNQRTLTYAVVLRLNSGSYQHRYVNPASYLKAKRLRMDDLGYRS